MARSFVRTHPVKTVLLGALALVLAYWGFAATPFAGP
jgi:hypothetical protein